MREVSVLFNESPTPLLAVALKKSEKLVIC